MSGERTEENLKMNEIFESLRIADLDAYDVTTLFTLSKKSMMGYNLRITKPGGFWPLLITELFIRRRLTEEHIIKAINATFTGLHRDFFENKHIISSLSAEQLAKDFIKAIEAKVRPRPGRGDNLIIRKLEDSYARSLEKLEKKGLVIDDYDVDNLVSLTGNIVEPYDEITEKGIAMVYNMSKMMEEEEGIRAKSITRLFKLLETFLNEFMMNVSIR